jgi:hypothetical protein
MKELPVLIRAIREFRGQFLMSNLLLSFYGDDFTGSTDAMESLARGGVRTVLFTDPPRRRSSRGTKGSALWRRRHDAGDAADEMERTLRPAFAAMRACNPPIVHYKVCSTFDSSPTVGSIGRAIDVGPTCLVSVRAGRRRSAVARAILRLSATCSRGAARSPSLPARSAPVDEQAPDHADDEADCACTWRSRRGSRSG